MAETTILSLMQRHHNVIEDLFKKMERAVKEGPEKFQIGFNNFSGQLRNHFSIEESVIFEFTKKEDPGRIDIIFSLMKEHSLMITLLGKIQKDFKALDFSGVSGMKEILFHHREEEETTLYPGLDQELSDETKKIITEKIQKVSGELLPG